MVLPDALAASAVNASRVFPVVGALKRRSDQNQNQYCIWHCSLDTSHHPCLTMGLGCLGTIKPDWYRIFNRDLKVDTRFDLLSRDEATAKTPGQRMARVGERRLNNRMILIAALLLVSLRQNRDEPIFFVGTSTLIFSAMIE
jgi:hypothetical protein